MPPGAIEWEEPIAADKQLLEDDPEQAFVHYRAALQEAEALGDPLELATAHGNLGRAAFLLGDYYGALRHHRQAYERYQSLDKPVLAAAELSKIGSTYYFSRVGDLDKALGAYNDAARRYTALGMEAEAAMNLNYTAYIEWARGNKEAALQIHLDALARFERTGNQKGIATACSDIGFTLNSLGRFEEGLTYSRRALALEEALGKVLMQIPTLNNIGMSYFGMGQLELALDYARRSLDLAEARSLQGRESEATALLHQLHAEMGDWEAAYTMLLEHKRLSDKVVISEQARKILEADMADLYDLKSRVAAIGQEVKLALADERLQLERFRSVALIVVLLLAIALLGALWWNNRLKQAANRQLAQQKEVLREKNMELEASMAQLLKSQSEVIRLEKDAALGVLTAGAAHEINNPMNVVRGALYGIEDELQRDGPPDPVEIRTLTEQIDAAVQRTSMIIKGLYAISRQTVAMLPFEVLDLGDCLDANLKAFQHPLAGRVRRIDGASFEPCQVMADSAALSQILEQLLRNACDAIEPEGEVRVALQAVEEDGGNWVELLIEDNGPGILPEHLERIYDPFFTTRESGQGIGIGIGLTLVSRLVSDLGGSIRHDVLTTGGTRVIVRLPALPKKSNHSI